MFPASSVVTKKLCGIRTEAGVSPVTTFTRQWFPQRRITLTRNSLLGWPSAFNTAERVTPSRGEAGVGDASEGIVESIVVDIVRLPFAVGVM